MKFYIINFIDFLIFQISNSNIVKTLLLIRFYFFLYHANYVLFIFVLKIEALKQNYLLNIMFSNQLTFCLFGVSFLD